MQLDVWSSGLVRAGKVSARTTNLQATQLDGSLTIGVKGT
jgi:hypothetical protein